MTTAWTYHCDPARALPIETAPRRSGKSLMASLRHASWLRYCVLGAFSCVGTLSASWLVGVAMNYCFSHPVIHVL